MFTSIILAAGMGTRMKSEKPKVIHKICGKELCRWVAESSKKAGAETVVSVIGHKGELVREALGDMCEYAVQAEQKGTGHALVQAIDYIKAAKENVVVLTGDAPLIKSETIENAIKHHRENSNDITVITAILTEPSGYGRIVRDENGNVLKIVEQKDATDEEKAICEVNSGMYVFNSASLADALGKLTPNNAQGEYYLTDTLEILLSEGKKAGAYTVSDNDEIRGINDRIQLSEAEEIMHNRIVRYHMLNGVTMHCPDSIYIEDGVEIGKDTEIDRNTEILSGTKIGSNCYIGMGSRLEGAVIGDGVEVLSSYILESEIGNNTHVGPFAYVRPNCKVGENVKVGDFVEIKNSVIDDKTKISHLTYIGDSDVGKNVNFGCGTVTCNYDGKKKFRSTIGDNSFVGCNTNLVSPVNVGARAYIAAGSTITEDIPDGSMSIARSRQTNKIGWADEKKKY